MLHVDFTCISSILVRSHCVIGWLHIFMVQLLHINFRGAFAFLKFLRWLVGRSICVQGCTCIWEVVVHDVFALVYLSPGPSFECPDTIGISKFIHGLEIVIDGPACAPKLLCIGKHLCVDLGEEASIHLDECRGGLRGLRDWQAHHAALVVG